MTIRELIIELMQFDLDEPVTIGLNRPKFEELGAKKDAPLIVNRLFNFNGTITIHADSDEDWNG